MTKPYETPEAIINALAAVHDDALVSHYDSQSEETFTECLVCGQWEDHSDICPMRAIRRWYYAEEDK